MADKSKIKWDTPFEPDTEIWDDLRALIGSGETFEAVKKVVSWKLEREREFHKRVEGSDG